MSTRPKGPEISQERAVQEGQRRQIPGTPGRSRTADAIEPSGDLNRDKMKQNQQRLHIGSDHKTESMKKGKRGSYP